jgi:hypothetical protein
VVTVVACWDSETGKSQIHLVLEANSQSPEDRRRQAREKVLELEASHDPARYEVVLATARSLEDFRQTDSRFFDARLDPY